MDRLSLSCPHFRLSISRLFVVALMMLVALWLSSAAFAAGGASADKKKDLLKAVRKGDAEKAASLVSDVSPEDGVDALAEAAKLGYVNVVQALVAKGVDVNGGLSPASLPSVLSSDGSGGGIRPSPILPCSPQFMRASSTLWPGSWSTKPAWRYRAMRVCSRT
jgi:hypothetical protein